MIRMNADAKPNPDPAKYTDPGCAYCPPSVRACRAGESEARDPGYCPSKMAADDIDAARAR